MNRPRVHHGDQVTYHRGKTIDQFLRFAGVMVDPANKGMRLHLRIVSSHPIEDLKKVRNILRKALREDRKYAKKNKVNSFYNPTGKTIIFSERLIRDIMDRVDLSYQQLDRKTYEPGDSLILLGRTD